MGVGRKLNGEKGSEKGDEERAHRQFPGLDLLLSASHRHWLRIATEGEKIIFPTFFYRGAQEHAVKNLAFLACN